MISASASATKLNSGGVREVLFATDTAFSTAAAATAADGYVAVSSVYGVVVSKTVVVDTSWSSGDAIDPKAVGLVTLSTSSSKRKHGNSSSHKKKRPRMHPRHSREGTVCCIILRDINYSDTLTVYVPMRLSRALIVGLRVELENAKMFTSNDGKSVYLRMEEYNSTVGKFNWK
jgi:hypothetical protein